MLFGAPLYLPTIRKALREIDKETNVKWFEAGGRWYLHSLKWDEHQDLRTDRRGRDLIPSYPGEVRDKSGSSPGVVPPEVEVEVEGEGKKEVELEVPKTADASTGASRPPLARPPGNGKDTATASGKKGTVKEAALNEVARLVRMREIDLAGASEKLRTFGFTHSEINNPALIELLRQAAN